MALRLRRGTDADRLLITPVEGELIYTTDTKLLYVGDGATVGGTLVTGAGGGGSATLDGLTDTDITGASDNDVLTYNSGTSKWEAAVIPAVGGVTTLDGLTDTGITLATGGDALVLNSNTNLWEATKITVDSLFDVTIAGTPNDGQVLTYSTAQGAWIAEDSLPLTSLTGDIVGSLFADDSTLLVDGITGSIIGPVNNNSVDTNRIQAGSVSIGGDTPNLIITSDTSTSLILTTAEEAGTVNSLKPLRVGGQSAGIIDSSVSIWNDTVNASAVISFHASDSTSTVTQTIAKARGNKTTPAAVQAADNLGAFQALGYNGSAYRNAGGLAITAIGAPEANYIPSQIALYTSASNGTPEVQFKVDNTGTSTFTGAAKLAVYADNTARDAAVTSPTAGMLVFNTTNTKFQGYTGSAWVDLN